MQNIGYGEKGALTFFKLTNESSFKATLPPKFQLKSDISLSYWLKISAPQNPQLLGCKKIPTLITGISKNPLQVNSNSNKNTH